MYIRSLSKVGNALLLSSAICLAALVTPAASQQSPRPRLSAAQCQPLTEANYEVCCIALNRRSILSAQQIDECPPLTTSLVSRAVRENGGSFGGNHVSYTGGSGDGRGGSGKRQAAVAPAVTAVAQAAAVSALAAIVAAVAAPAAQAVGPGGQAAAAQVAAAPAAAARVAAAVAVARAVAAPVVVAAAAAAAEPTFRTTANNRRRATSAPPLLDRSDQCDELRSLCSDRTRTRKS